MSRLAEIFIEEPAPYRQELSRFLREGLPFPAARMEALSSYLSTGSLSVSQAEDIRLALSSPNNILAIEYLKELKRRKSAISPYPILRTGGGYHDTTLSSLASATAIRKLLSPRMNRQGNEALPSPGVREQLNSSMPNKACLILLDYMKESPLIHEDDFSTMLKYKLLLSANDGFEDFADCSQELSNRIKGKLYQFRSFSGFCGQLKSKEITHSRISRMLLHILLNIYQEDYRLGRKLDYLPYLRVLGFRKSAAPLLGQIKTHSRLPLLTKMADADRIMKEMYPSDSFAHRMLALDIFAADLYASAVAGRSGSIVKNEYNHGIVIK